MLRHLKMELRKEQMQQLDNGALITTTPTVQNHQQQPSPKTQRQRRSRGRRSSKPMMEKRRRARINECLDILKSFVLRDSSASLNLGAENQDEDSIARTILRSSGLINRHRGRKNPNKLEKADILELTVDYVRRLQIQRSPTAADDNNTIMSSIFTNTQRSTHATNSNIRVPVTNQLSVNLKTENNNTMNINNNISTHSSTSSGNSSIQSRCSIRACSFSPPSESSQSESVTSSSSSASSSPQPLLAISSNISSHPMQAYKVPQNSPALPTGNIDQDALDLSDGKHRATLKVNNNKIIFTPDDCWPCNANGENSADCWRPWDLTAAQHQHQHHHQHQDHYQQQLNRHIDDTIAYAGLLGSNSRHGQ